MRFARVVSIPDLWEPNGRELKLKANAELKAELRRKLQRRNVVVQAVPQRLWRQARNSGETFDHGKPFNLSCPKPGHMAASSVCTAVHAATSTAAVDCFDDFAKRKATTASLPKAQVTRV